MRDISENICCCVIRKKRAASNDKFGLQYISSAKRAAKQKSPDEVAESGGLCGCCPCEISVDALEDYELEALHQYDDWVKQQTKVDLACRAAALESQYLLSYIASQTLQLLSTKDPADPQKATIQENIDEAKRKMKDYGTMLMSKRISDAQGEILKKKTSAITKKRVVQMATFWQNMMNYLFYVVFVINSFITGLVVTSSVVSGKVWAMTRSAHQASPIFYQIGWAWSVGLRTKFKSLSRLILAASSVMKFCVHRSAGQRLTMSLDPLARNFSEK